jgi:hypothetical protein
MLNSELREINRKIKLNEARSILEVENRELLRYLDCFPPGAKTEVFLSVGHAPNYRVTWLGNTCLFIGPLKKIRNIFFWKDSAFSLPYSYSGEYDFMMKLEPLTQDVFLNWTWDREVMKEFNEIL